MTFRNRKNKLNLDIVITEDPDKPNQQPNQPKPANMSQKYEPPITRTVSHQEQFKVGNDVVIFDKESGLWKIKK